MNRSFNGSRGLITVISGPSGSGKGTLIAGAMKRDGRLCYSVSATTREMRPGETEAVSYYFKTEEEFSRLIEQGEILEWDEFCGNRYGTLRQELSSRVEAGCDVILDLTVAGALAIKQAFPEDACTVFILPPSVEELENRIRGRRREGEEQLRMRVARAEAEMACVDRFDYVLVNDDLNEATDGLCAIIDAERRKFIRNKDILIRMNLKTKGELL